MTKAKQKQCKHCAHPTGTSTTTLMTLNNMGTTDVRCCKCGWYGVERWRESEERIKGHGPYATRTVRVVEDTLWFEPPTLTTTHRDGDGIEWWSIVGGNSTTVTLPDDAAAPPGGAAC